MFPIPENEKVLATSKGVACRNWESRSRSDQIEIQKLVQRDESIEARELGQA
jgi:hypothetical protein